VSTQLLQEPYRFDFFQAVRLAERMAKEARSAARQPVGYEGSPREEAVRFRALPSLSFPPGAVHEVRVPQTSEVLKTSEVSGTPGEPQPLEMVVSFMGLTGPQGVLPDHYTAMVINRVRKRDFALRDFFDLFNHRAVSLFHRAWEKYRFALGYERALLAGDGREDLFTQCLFSLVGLGTGGLRRRNQFDDDVFLYYAGLFAHYPRSALSLELMVADFFQLPAAIRQFQGQWLRLGDDDLSVLPSPRRPAGLNTALGTNVVIGERVWNIESKFRLRLGPLSYRQFCSFMPSAELLRSVSHLVRCYAGPQFDFDVQLVLKAGEVPWCRLGGDGTDPSRLGWNTWVRCGEFTHDVDDAIFPEKV
jgi:type VI secretion system protein ImpH